MLKNANSILLISAALFLAFGAGWGVSVVFRDKQSGGPGMEFYSVRGYERLENAALSGSVDASGKLLLMFERCWSGASKIDGLSQKQCTSNFRYWEHVDSENGGTLGTSAIFVELVQSGSCADARRAIFWAGKLSEEVRAASVKEANRAEVANCPSK